MKFTTTLRKLSDLDVKFVSLVDRSANRIPFRVIKSQENQMLDLSRIHNIMKGDKPSALTSAPATKVLKVEAVVVATSDDATITKIQEVLKAAGMEMALVKKYEDGTAVLHTDPDYEKDTQVVSVGDSMAVVVKGFESYSPGLSFSEAAKSRGFFDNVRGAMDTMSSFISTAMYNSASPAEARTSITKSMKELSDYVMALLDSLPTAVFKAEKEVKTLIDANAAAGADALAAADAAAAAAAAAAAVVTKMDDTMHDDDDYEMVDGKKVKKTKKADAVVVAPVADETAVLLKTVAESMSALAAQVATITKSVADLGEAQKATEQKVAEAVSKADTASTVLKNSVVVAAQAAADHTPAPVKKADSDPRTGLFDTAYLPKTR